MVQVFEIWVTPKGKPLKYKEKLFEYKIPGWAEKIRDSLRKTNHYRRVEIRTAEK